MLSSNDNISNLQTDAISEPPRRKNASPVPEKQVPSSGGNHKTIIEEHLNAKVEDEVPVPPRRKKHSPKPEPINLTKDDKFGHIPNNECTNGTSNVINVVNSCNVHIGGLYNFNLKKSENKSSKNKEDKKKKAHSNKDIKESESVKAVRQANEKCTFEYIDIVKRHLGKNWKNIFRKLDYSDGEIETLYIDHFSDGISEVIYQGLLDWTRNNPEEATLGKLCSVLWEEQCYEVVQKVASKWKKMNS